MSAEDANRQIEQMVRFIEQEAKEKADEIRFNSDQEFNATKLQMIEQARVALREEFRLREQNQLTQKKIERSTLINNARLSKIQRKNEVMDRVRDEARTRLAAVAQHAKYADLLVALVVQGLIRFKEEEVVVRFREQDKHLARDVLPRAEALYHQVMLRDTQLDVSVRLRADERTITAGTDSTRPLCSGGVMLLCNRGKIVLDNTLDRRLDLAFAELKPTLRKLAFDARQA